MHTHFKAKILVLNKKICIILIKLNEELVLNCDIMYF